VVDVVSSGVVVDPVEPVPLEAAVEVDVEVAVEVAVEVVPDVDADVPLVVFDVPLPRGALTLAPPPLLTVEMPPVARSLTFVETIVVDVDACPDAFDEAGAALEASIVDELAGCASAIAGADDTAGPASLELELGLTAGAGCAASGCGCATAAARARWCAGAAGSAC